MAQKICQDCRNLYPAHLMQCSNCSSIRIAGTISEAPPDLLSIFPLALPMLRKVMSYGATTHDKPDWVEKSASFHRSHAEIHLTDADRGIDKDEDSGLPNDAHAACRALMALEVYLRGMEK